MENQSQKLFQKNFNELREILNALELISDSPVDEFDSLNHQILSQFILRTRHNRNSCYYSNLVEC